MMLKWLFVSETGEEKMHGQCSGLTGDGTLLVVELYSGDVLEVAHHSVVMLGRLCKSTLVNILVLKYMYLYAT